MVLSNANQAAIVNWLNEKFKEKKSGLKFTAQDVQGYVKRGKLPRYIGGNSIVRVGIHCKTFNVE